MLSGGYGAVEKSHKGNRGSPLTEAENTWTVSWRQVTVAVTATVTERRGQITEEKDETKETEPWLYKRRALSKIFALVC